MKKKCLGVVDGGMLMLENDESVVLARVKVPRLGLPGGSTLRMMTQRLVQDQDVDVTYVGKSPQGDPLVEAVVSGKNVNDYVIATSKELGYG